MYRTRAARTPQQGRTTQKAQAGSPAARGVAQGAAAAYALALHNPRALTPSAILTLQRTVGNTAVNMLLPPRTIRHNLPEGVPHLPRQRPDAPARGAGSQAAPLVQRSEFGEERATAIAEKEYQQQKAKIETEKQAKLEKIAEQAQARKAAAAKEHPDVAALRKKALKAKGKKLAEIRAQLKALKDEQASLKQAAEKSDEAEKARESANSEFAAALEAAGKTREARRAEVLALLTALEEAGFSKEHIEELLDQVGVHGLKSLHGDLGGAALKGLHKDLGTEKLASVSTAVGSAKLKGLHDELGGDKLADLAKSAGGEGLASLHGLGAEALKDLSKSFSGAEVAELHDGLAKHLKSLHSSFGAATLKELHGALGAGDLAGLTTAFGASTLKDLHTLGTPKLQQLAKHPDIDALSRLDKGKLRSVLGRDDAAIALNKCLPQLEYDADSLVTMLAKVEAAELNKLLVKATKLGRDLGYLKKYVEEKPRPTAVNFAKQVYDSIKKDARKPRVDTGRLRIAPSGKQYKHYTYHSVISNADLIRLIDAGQVEFEYVDKFQTKEQMQNKSGWSYEYNVRFKQSGTLDTAVHWVVHTHRESGRGGQAGDLMGHLKRYDERKLKTALRIPVNERVLSALP